MKASEEKAAPYKATRSRKANIDAKVPHCVLRLVHDKNGPIADPVSIYSPADIAKAVKEYFTYLPVEHVLLLLLNTKGTITHTVTISTGGLASSVLEPRSVMQACILGNAASFVLVHNHPSGNPEPSREDVRVTRQINECGKLFGIPMLDHVIMAGDGFTSMEERGLTR